MKVWRSRGPAPSAEERRRDRRARLFGLSYLAMALLIAVVHDQLLKLPPGRLAHECEQIALAAMMVLGMLGGMLAIKGRRLLDDPHRSAGPEDADPERACKRPSSRDTRRRDPRATAFDTRAGIAALLAQRALEKAARASRTAPKALGEVDVPRA